MLNVLHTYEAKCLMKKSRTNIKINKNLFNAKTVNSIPK